MRFAVPTVRFLKNSNEHGRNVLQEIFGRRTLENFGVLFQFVGDLINDEATANCERVMSLLQQRAFQKSLEEKGAHRKSNSHPLSRYCPVGSAFGRPGMPGSLGS